jgi:hypothetical protein
MQQGDKEYRDFENITPLIRVLPNLTQSSFEDPDFLDYKDTSCRMFTGTIMVTP